MTASGPRPSVSSRIASAQVVVVLTRSKTSTPARAGPLRAAPARGRRRSPSRRRGAGRCGRTCRRSGRARGRRRCRRRGIAAYSTACHAVGSTSDRKRNRSSGGPSGTLIGPYCAWGTRRYSAWPPGTCAVELGVAEQRGAGALLAAPGWSRTGTAAPASHMKQWPQEMLNGITTRSPGVMCVDLRAHLLDDAHRLVTEDIPLVDERAHDLVEVQVGPAHAARGDAHDGVRRLLDRRIGDRVHADVSLAVEGDCFHARPSTRRRRGYPPGRRLLGSSTASGGASTASAAASRLAAGGGAPNRRRPGRRARSGLTGCPGMATVARSERSALEEPRKQLETQTGGGVRHARSGQQRWCACLLSRPFRRLRPSPGG